MVFRELTSAQRSAIRVAATGNLDRLKELLNGRDVIKDSDKLITAIHEHRLVADDHDRISLDYLLMAAARGHVEMLRYLLGRYPYPGNAIPPEAVVNAVNSASTETLQVLLDLNPPVTLNVHITHTGKPLDHALSLDRRQDALKMTEFLLQHGTGPNIDCSPMESAILSSWPELVRLLERYGAKPYPLEDELRLLPRAAATGRLEAVIRLVEKGADLHEPCGKPPHSGSPLYLAASSCYAEVVKYLLRAGADPNKVGPYGKTPLEEARERTLNWPQWNGIVELLLEYGARG